MPLPAVPRAHQDFGRTMNIKDSLKISLLILANVAVVGGIYAAYEAYENLPAWKAEIGAGIGKQVDAKLGPLVKQYAATGQELAATARQANGLIADVRADLPGLENAANTEVSVINGQISTANGSIASIVTQVNPAITSAKKAIDQVNAALPDFLDCYNDGFGNDNCLFNRYQGVSKSFEQMAQTIDATVKTEAAPTAEAIRKSAEGTATSTANAAQLISDSDKFVNLTTNLIYGPKTFMQRFRAFVWGTANLVSHTAAAW